MDKYEKRLLELAYRTRAHIVRWWAAARFGTRRSFSRHRRKFEALIWIALMVSGLIVSGPLERRLTPLLTPDLTGDIQSLLLAIGGALIGATAIASSFVLFAIQVNIERLPYGLFRRLSSDRRLLAAFGVSFVIAVGLASLSIVQDREWIAAAILIAALGGLVSLRLLLYAYRRSLQLVSPAFQLGMLRRDSSAEMARWNKWVRWMTPVLPKLIEAGEGEHELPAFDTARLHILEANPNWTATITHSIRQAAAFARRAGEQGDREIAAAALSTVTSLNAGYVSTKGRTFFASVPFFDNPLVTDRVINLTLEEMRQLTRAAVSRDDEAQIELIFKAFTGLVRTYLAIEYAGVGSSPTHANLATGYLERAIESVVPRGLADTLMEGQRNLGSVAQLFLTSGHPTHAVSPVQTMGTIGVVGIAKADLRPVTLAAMEQFADFTLRIILTDSHDLRYLIGELRRSETNLAKVFLNVPESRLSSIHSTYLAPFYSLSPQAGLLTRMRQLADDLSNADAGNENAQIAARNLEEWADGLYQSQKELLLVAVEKRSPFVLDMLNWITDVSEVLYIVSKAPACPEHSRGRLERHADWLFATLSWIERDAETVAFIENYSFTETVFDFGAMAHGRGALQLQVATRNLLLVWGFQGCQRPDGWSTLSETLLALVALSLLDPAPQADQTLLANVVARLAAAGAPAQEIRTEAATAIRAASEALDQEAWGGRIEHTLAHADRPRTEALLNGIADLLSPAPQGA